MKCGWMAAVVVMCAGFGRAAEGTVTHTAVPIAGAQDAIVDDVHHQVLVTTSGGSVQRYSLTGHALVSPWNVGVNLRGIDLTSNGAFAYIVDQTAGPTQGIVRKVNTATGALTNLFYNLAGEGAGGYDIVRLSNNRMMFTANNQFSGASSVVRFIDLSNDAITIRQNPGGGGSDQTERQTDLFRSADGSRVFMTGGNTSAGSVRVYDTATDSYPVSTNLWAPLNGISAALSPNGSLLAFQGYNVSLSLVHSADLSLVNVFPSYRSGLGFNPAGYLFMADWQTELFRVYDPGTQTEIAQIPAGFDLNPFITGNIVFSADGGTMVYQDINGIHVYEGVAVPEPSMMAACGAGAALVVGGRRGRRATIPGAG